MKGAIALAVVVVAVTLTRVQGYSVPSNWFDKPDPYTVHLTLRKNFEVVRKCGGIRFSQVWVLTAAECLDKDKYDHVIIALPRGWLFQQIQLSFDRIELSVHPNYDEATKANNVALMKGPYWLLPDSANVLPLLPGKSDLYNKFSGQSAVSPRWTKTDDLVFFEVHDQKTSVARPFWCKITYFGKYSEDHHICASGSFGKGLTKDDTGSPLVIENSDGKDKVIGIASSIIPWTGLLPLPTVYIKIQPYLHWIEQVTNVRVLD